MVRRVAICLCLLVVALPVWAQQWEIVPEKDARVPTGKVSVVGGVTNETGVKFVVNNLDIMQPIEIVLAAGDASKPVTLAVFKESPQQPLLSEATDASGSAVAKFRTQDSVHLLVSGPAGAKYQLMTWQGPTIEVPTPTAFVPMDKNNSPLVEGVTLTPPAQATAGGGQGAAETRAVGVFLTPTQILLALILVAMIILIIVLVMRRGGGKSKGTAAAIVVAIALSGYPATRADDAPTMDLAPKKVDAAEVHKAINERLNQLREQCETWEKMGIKVEPEAIKIPKPGEKAEGGEGGGSPSFLNMSGKMAGQFVTDTKLILAFLEEFGLIDPREAAVQPNYNPPGQPLIPSRCAGTGQCGACFNDANAKLDKSRKLLEDMYVIYKQTELKAGRIHELANAAAGLSPYAQLAWTAIKNNPNEGMNVAQRHFYDVYDTNLGKLLTMANEGLIGVGACERDNFKDYDWYARYGMIYYNFLKERYTRK